MTDEIDTKSHKGILVPVFTWYDGKVEGVYGNWGKTDDGQKNKIDIWMIDA